MKMRVKKRTRLDRIFLGRFKYCLTIMFPSCIGTTTLMLLLLLGLSFTQQVLIYNTGLLPSQFIEVLVEKNKQGFQHTVVLAIIIILLVALAKSLVNYVSGVLYVFWRGNLTRYIHQHYFSHDAFYKLNVLQQHLDNLDQRITQDVDKLTLQFSKIFSTLIISPFIIAYYTYQCYKSTGYIGPVSIYSYFVVGTLINKVIMAPIVKLVFQQENLEGNFRFKHMHLRVNSESTAFYRSGVLEEKKTNSKLNKLLDTQLKLVNYQFLLQCSVNIFDYFGSIVSYLVVSLPVFSGSFDSLSAGELAGIVSKYSFVSMYLIYSFSQLIDLSNQVSDIAGYTHRVGEVLDYFIINAEPTNNSVCFKDDLDFGTIIKIENLTFFAPMSVDEPLVKDLNLKICDGENVMVTGKTGCGKSSLLRVISGLWKAEFGNILIKNQDVMFLPQKPLLTDGSLKQQIVYPEDVSPSLDDLIHSSTRNEKILECLSLVKLEEVRERAGGLDVIVDWNWEDVLSPGEMQRLSFARLFYHQPKCALLDEASSALDVETESEFYQLCNSLGITLVTVGHRKSLYQYHQYLLTLDGASCWHIQPL